MIERSLIWAAEKLNSRASANVAFSGVSIDTRTIKPGNLFVPIVGEKFNGHDFIDQAYENGAAAVLWQADQHSRTPDIPLIEVDDTLTALQELAQAYLSELDVTVVGITGSNGKTTTKDMIASLLGTTYKVQKTEGNLNNHLGVPLTLLRLETSTQIAIVEMGMSGLGEIHLLSNLAKPHTAVITNIGEAHLQDLGSREAIADAKFEITEGLQPEGIFIFHGDEPLLQERVANKSLRAITFGDSPENDYYPLEVTQYEDMTAFKINQFDQELVMPVLGKHNVINALAAIAVARTYDVSWSAIAGGLNKIKVTGMRLELKKSSSGVAVINDAYNASPTSTKAAIDLVASLAGYKRKILVLGDMLELGDNELAFHQEVGEHAGELNIDHIFTYGSRAEWIAKGALQYLAADRVHVFSNKEDLIQMLSNYVLAGDVVLVKASRGMRLEEVVQAVLA
ncbi:UDP-N-acetylmuramoyl-tripeptide--D-alanyl-D-alanine ligase [Bacillus sp. HMF5848]|uniref:UDP-N-acetylmuramoyl-tripeptide--D-alanyl-D- alanine ligase n=1 Tax=Bacillus sp. HMF5848 TaxID=2495421 RepID=UPI000F78FA8B|nr:UDP-N-acetylmuramoyl-tripeptide--D-alanyl-D-alanine ligase [Bacillus sp. HMF5848]RSK25652.1 UDP-N-acetylmuramoyl-tripeptide--D-alanyl-D-alanine ligase [Bacillus sp. HMF5848]